ncbi:MAG: hypothetical protein HWN66_05600 [Candidatus Helarchaeota archaeon]|nr:hypothetical protein [Candidatus Helarchaeota archaeon]
MKNRLSIGEIFDVLETEINLLMEENDGGEHTGKIKSISLLLEDRVKELYGLANWRKAQEKPEISESRKETCMCGQPWVYEDSFFGRVFGRCEEEYCFMNVKRRVGYDEKMKEKFSDLLTIVSRYIWISP